MSAPDCGRPFTFHIDLLAIIDRKSEPHHRPSHPQQRHAQHEPIADRIHSNVCGDSGRQSLCAGHTAGATGHRQAVATVAAHQRQSAVTAEQQQRHRGHQEWHRRQRTRPAQRQLENTVSSTRMRGRTLVIRYAATLQQPGGGLGHPQTFRLQRNCKTCFIKSNKNRQPTTHRAGGIGTMCVCVCVLGIVPHHALS